MAIRLYVERNGSSSLEVAVDYTAKTLAFNGVPVSLASCTHISYTNSLITLVYGFGKQDEREKTIAALSQIETLTFRREIHPQYNSVLPSKNSDEEISCEENEDTGRIPFLEIYVHKLKTSLFRVRS